MRLNWTIQRRLIPLALGLSFVLALLLAPAASAAETRPTPGPPTASGTVATADGAAAAAIGGCWVTAKAGVDGLNVRLRANATSTRLGIIYRPTRVAANCQAVAGGSYTACGGTTNWWIPVTYQGRAGFVAWLCAQWGVN